jgi:hypothetical protein
MPGADGEQPLSPRAPEKPLSRATSRRGAKTRAWNQPPLSETVPNPPAIGGGGSSRSRRYDSRVLRLHVGDVVAHVRRRLRVGLAEYFASSVSSACTFRAVGRFTIPETTSATVKSACCRFASSARADSTRLATARRPLARSGRAFVAGRACHPTALRPSTRARMGSSSRSLPDRRLGTG